MTNVYGLLGAGLLVAACVKLFRHGPSARYWALAALVLAVAPIQGISLAGLVRAHTGDLSVTSVVLLLLGLGGALGVSERRAVSVCVVGLAAFLYPMALGIGRFDPYRLGYEPRILLGGLALVVAWSLMRGTRALMVGLVGAVAGFGLGVHESVNLWDYVIDPWLTIWALVQLWRGGGADA